LGPPIEPADFWTLPPQCFSQGAPARHLPDPWFPFWTFLLRVSYPPNLAKSVKRGFTSRGSSLLRKTLSDSVNYAERSLPLSVELAKFFHLYAVEELATATSSTLFPHYFVSLKFSFSLLWIGPSPFLCALCASRCSFVFVWICTPRGRGRGHSNSHGIFKDKKWLSSARTLVPFFSQVHFKSITI